MALATAHQAHPAARRRLLTVIAVLWTATASAQTLPGGATHIQETHGDWRVTCAQHSARRVCAFSQQQTAADTGQLVVGVELRIVSTDAVEGTLVLPFGLAVNRPVTVKVDEGAVTPLPFRTCLPIGCLVTLSFPPETVAALRKGGTLVVQASADTTQVMPFRISLNGFGSALDRTAALSK
jgi:invasion protein IalB